MKARQPGKGQMPTDILQEHDSKEFWSKANLNFNQPWYRLEKCAHIVTKISRHKSCDLLDVGCGPGTLGRVLPPNIRYHGIDIAIHEPAQNLIEADITQEPVHFRGKKFDIVVAQGIFEYVKGTQSQKFDEIADLLADGGSFVTSYWNFGHRKPHVYERFSNVQSIEEFRRDLERRFVVRRSFPTSHNWSHGEPNRKMVKSINMHLNVNIPILSPLLAVEYFFICSARVL